MINIILGVVSILFALFGLLFQLKRDKDIALIFWISAYVVLSLAGLFK